MRVARAVVLVPMLALAAACGSATQGGTSGASATTGHPQGNTTGAMATGGSSTGGAPSGSSSGGTGSGPGSVAGPASLSFNVAFAGYAYLDPHGGGAAKSGGYGLVVALSEQDLTSQCAPSSVLNMQSNKRLVCLMLSASAGGTLVLSQTASPIGMSQDYQQYYSDEWNAGTGLYVDVGLDGPIMQLADATSGTVTFNDTSAPLTGSFMAQVEDPSQKTLGQLTGNFTAGYCPALAFGCALPNPQ